MKRILTKSLGAFTMAEILISLTIIGVIAAITLPTLKGNINERTWATQKKALFSRMSQAVALVDSLNSYASAQGFVTEALSDVLKINNVCDREHLADCGLNTDQLITVAGAPRSGGFPSLWSGLGVTNTWGDDDQTKGMVAAFETQNGESIAIFYNPDCIPDNDDTPTDGATVNMFDYVCANMIYDLNAERGPNTVGKDIGFMTVFYSSDPVVVSAIPGTVLNNDQSNCPEESRIPNALEAASLGLNSNLLETATVQNWPIFTSGKAVNGSTIFYYSQDKISDEGLTQVTSDDAPGDSTKTLCVKR